MEKKRNLIVEIRQHHVTYSVVCTRHRLRYELKMEGKGRVGGRKKERAGAEGMGVLPSQIWGPQRVFCIV